MSFIDRLLRGFVARRYRRIAKLPDGYLLLNEVAEPSSWMFGESACPHCKTEHPDGRGETLHQRWAPYFGDFGGSGYRLFLCDGCGRVLEEDISS